MKETPVITSAIEQEDAEYAAALAAYRVAMERLQKAKRPITARENLKRQAAIERQNQERAKVLQEYEEETTRKRFEYEAIYRKHCGGMPAEEIVKQYGKAYQVGDIEYIISLKGRYWR